MATSMFLTEQLPQPKRTTTGEMRVNFNRILIPTRPLDCKEWLSFF